MRYAQVVPDTRSILPNDIFTYVVPEEHLERAVIGARVEMPFGAREVVGVIVDQTDHSDHDAKAITRVLDEVPILTPHLVALARYIAARYCAPMGEVIKAMIPKGVRSARPGGRRRGPRTSSAAMDAARAVADGGPETPLLLSEAQSAAVAPLLDAVANGRHRRVLLHGVTGSGKTEVYLSAIAATLAASRQAIVMVPEIALTPQMIRRFAARFPGAVSVMHSALTEAERAREWLRIRDGEVGVVIGSRSAIFAPLPQLGLVVVDEEDSTAYKQDRVPRYHAVDVALELGRLCNAPVVLGSATPRIETFYAAHTDSMELVTMPDRITGRPLPEIEVVDLREELKAGNFSPLSQTLERALAECHEAGGQSILFLNRRGTASVILCRGCGEALMCDQCSVSLVYHADRRRCDCHYCGASRTLPETCPKCRSPKIRQLGMGTERLEVEMRERFPAVRLLRMDRDTTTTRDAYFTIYDAFRRGDADCMIGTQMVAKGWDLGNVRLVGIVNADTALHFPDYRSGEVTFSLLTQVAGRAGRGDEPARVVLQTYSPGHYAVRHATTHDYAGFAHEEIRLRKAMNFPPYSRLCTCTFSHREDAVGEAEAKEWVQKLSATLDPGAGLTVLGPTPAFLHRLRGEYRWQFTVRGVALETVFPHLPQGRGRGGGSWSIDVDPSA